MAFINLRTLSQLFSLRDLRNGVMGLLVVFGGIGLSALTYYAHLTGQPRLAGISAGVSLVFVLLILIFVVPPLARNAGREASQLNLPFEFTTGGAIMLGLIVIVGFSAWNTGNNLLFLVLSFLTASMVVGFFAGGFCLKKLDVKMRFPETIFAGRETPILVSIHNRKRIFPSFSVIAEVRGKEREHSIAIEDLKNILPRRLAERFARPPVVRRMLSYFVYVASSETAENQSGHIFQNRGRFLIKDFELSTRFPFGFFRHRRRLPARETELIVFPKIGLPEVELENLPLESGKLAANKRGSGQDLLALRDYQPNDDLRRIDWKATARARNLIVREFSAEDDRKITVFFDTRVPRDGAKTLTLREKIEAEQSGKSVVESERFERGVIRTAALIAHFSEEQAEVRLVTGSEKDKFGLGSRKLYECLKRLAVIEPVFVEKAEPAEIIDNLNDLIEDTGDSHIFLITTANESNFPIELSAKINIINFE
ncbi:MAG: DUF58 domain-containing protein [Blastocatellia bacterium]|nr:DUF58 domain-containing protein [Blastocatellia bacterium]